MIYRYLPFVLLFAITTIACNSSSESQRDKLYKEVMAVHDEVMPLTSTINKKARQLKAIMPELSEELATQAQGHILALNTADDAMMRWMDEFNPPNTESKAITYLTSEKKKIQEVSDLMKKSLTEATSFIDGLKDQ